MRICQIITRMIVGGAQENTLLTCEYLHRRGHEVVLLTGPAIGAEGSMLDRAMAGGYRVEIIESMRRSISPLKDLISFRRLYRLLRELQPDIVHTHSSKAGVLGRLAARDAGCPHIVHTIHGLPFNRLQSPRVNALYIRLEHHAAQFTDRLVSVADAMTEQAVAAGVAPRRLFETIYSGMATEPYLHAEQHRAEMRAKLKLEDGDVVVGTIARLSPGKGHDSLINAMQPLRDAPPGLKFLWVGDGPLRPALEDRLTRLGLANRVILVGLVPSDQIPLYLSAMDVVLHPSYWEGLSRALPQALLAGLPVISYDIDGAREVVRHGENGFLLRTGDAEQLTWAIETMFSSPAMRQKMGNRHRTQWAEQFDAERMGSQLERLYREVVRGKFRRPAATDPSAMA
ncbi:MAG: glycosyltransferase family 4 protein [Phycisphaerae bacterium]|nr:glycosyltransferase family 4 protein [Phycisphaerae bacterium]